MCRILLLALLFTCYSPAQVRTLSLAEVIEYADRAIAHYAQLDPKSVGQRALIRADLVYIHQRRGVTLLKSGVLSKDTIDCRDRKEKDENLS